MGDAVQRVWIVAVESLTKEKVKQLPAPHYISGKEKLLSGFFSAKEVPQLQLPCLQFNHAGAKPSGLQKSIHD